MANLAPHHVQPCLQVVQHQPSLQHPPLQQVWRLLRSLDDHFIHLSWLPNQAVTVMMVLHENPTCREDLTAHKYNSLGHVQDCHASSNFHIAAPKCQQPNTFTSQCLPCLHMASCWLLASSEVQRKELHSPPCALLLMLSSFCFVGPSAGATPATTPTAAPPAGLQLQGQGSTSGGSGGLFSLPGKKLKLLRWLRRSCRLGIGNKGGLRRQGTKLLKSLGLLKERKSDLEQDCI